jgi:uncharacterized cupredoxin-like copper-binding protein
MVEAMAMHAVAMRATPFALAPGVLRAGVLRAGVLLVGVLLVACGGAATETTVEPDTSISATATEFSFEPSSWTVPAGREVTLELTDDGALEHEWVILTAGSRIASSAEFTEDMVLWEIEAHPDQTVTATFTAPTSGSYQVICAIEGHLEAGMEGALDVVE